jgi:hypothetical protein
MRASPYVACAVVGLALMACRTTQGDAAATKGDGVAPGAGAAADPDAATTDASVRQTARFHLTPSTKGRLRKFAPGFAVSRVDASGAATPVALDPPGADTSNGALVTATPLTPGHYRAHFIIATCAPDSPDGVCNGATPKPDEAEFDVPATGDVDVDVR